MKHNEIYDNDLIDKYLLHQLTAEQENKLEEHLLFCEECQKFLDKRKATIQLIRTNITKIDTKSKSVTQKKVNGSKGQIRFLKIAASIIVLLSAGWGLNQWLNTYSGKKISNYKPIIDSIIIGKKKGVFKIDTVVNKNTDIVAENYSELPEMENFIKNPMRSLQIKVISPKIGQKYNETETIKIEWDLEKTDSLSFVVFNNNASLVFEKTISESFIYQHNLKKGLYYWQLETKEEAIFTAKFLIK